MDDTELVKMLEAQKKVLTEAQRNRGQRATNKASRAFLQMSFAQKVS